MAGKRRPPVGNRRASRAFPRKAAPSARRDTKSGCESYGYKRWYLTRDYVQELQNMIDGRPGDPDFNRYPDPIETQAAYDAIDDGEVKDDALDLHITRLPWQLADGDSYVTKFSPIGKISHEGRRITCTTFCTRGRLQTYLHMEWEKPPFKPRREVKF